MLVGHSSDMIPAACGDTGDLQRPLPVWQGNILLEMGKWDSEESATDKVGNGSSQRSV